MIDLPLFFGTTLSIASFYLASEREIARLRGDSLRTPWSTLRRLPLVLSIGIGLCVNQTRAVFEALLGRETEFVRTPKHGIQGKMESWSGKRYRAARSLTPTAELLMAAYFTVAVEVAVEHGHYIRCPSCCSSFSASAMSGPCRPGRALSASPASPLAARRERARAFHGGRAFGGRHARLYPRPDPPHFRPGCATGSRTRGQRAPGQRRGLTFAAPPRVHPG